VLAVEREQGESKLADLTNGVKFLRRFSLPDVSRYNTERRVGAV
jgi:hypothetical protein